MKEQLKKYIIGTGLHANAALVTVAFYWVLYQLFPNDPTFTKLEPGYSMLGQAFFFYWAISNFFSLGHWAMTRLGIIKPRVSH